jgi:HK97 family phage prohead protease
MKTRQITFCLDEVRLDEGANGEPPRGILGGVAATYGNAYMGEYGLEQLERGAFDEDLAKRNGIIPVFYQHGWAKAANAAPIGYAKVSSKAKTLNVQATLFIDSDPTARSVFLAAQAGALREWSIGYLPTKTTNLQTKQGEPVVQTNQGQLLEVSVVVKGANPETTMPLVAEHRGDDPDSDDELELVELSDSRAIRDELARQNAWRLLELAPRETIRALCYGADHTDHKE